MKASCFIGISAVAIFALSANAQSSFSANSQKTGDISEVAFRYLMTEASRDYKPKVFCISSAIPLDMKFVGRLGGVDARVVWSIECTPDGMGGIFYSKNKLSAVSVTISRIRWISGREAEVNGGFRWGDFHGEERTIKVVQRDGRWIVRSKDP